jgi:hypothetical protein
MSLGPKQLEARLLAYPYVSETAFISGETRLSDPSDTTKNLGGRATLEMREIAAGLSLEQLTGWRRRAWRELQPHPSPPDHDLLTGLHLLARSRLRADGPELRLAPRSTPDGRPWETPELAEDWYQLGQELPHCLLHLAWPSDRAHHIELEPPIEALVQRGLTEQHSHLGSARSFLDLWSHLHHVIGAGTRTPIKIKDSQEEDQLGGVDVAHAWGAAAIARALLQRWTRRHSATQIEELYEHHPERASVRKQVDWVMREPGGRAPLSLDVVRVRLHSLLKDPLDEAALQQALWQAVADKVLPPPFRRLFLQYLRLFCWSWRWVTLPKGTGGLDWFKVSYRRIGALTDTSSLPAMAQALEAEEEGSQLQSVEWRIMPPTPGKTTWTKQIIAHAVEVLRSRPPERRPEIGFVLHFPKPDDDDKDEVATLRYGKWIRTWLDAASALTQMLRDCPELLVYVRGLDLCNRELALPLWPALLPWERARRASQEAAIDLARRRPGWGKIQPFRATVHMGEEFRHLQDGLRRMAELIEFDILQVGDRVGHGLALGTKVGDWCDRFQTTVSPLGERLDDLIWEWEAYAARHVVPVQGRTIWLEDELQRLGRKLYGQPTTAHDLVLARRLRHDRGVLRALWSDPGWPVNAGAEHTLAHRHLTSRTLRALLSEPEEVRHHETDRATLKALQNHVRGLYARQSITVEANPSSNLAIGDLSTTADHPMFRLSPLSPKKGRPPVAVSINCDNLLVSDTNLAQEMNKTWKCLLHAGASSEEALAWLEKARIAGWNSRFTLPASKADATLNWFSRRHP